MGQGLGGQMSMGNRIAYLPVRGVGVRAHEGGASTANVARMLRIGKLAGSMAWGLLRAKFLARAGGVEGEERSHELREQLRELFARTGGELRGVPMKVAQIFASRYTPDLSKQQALAGIYQSLTPVPLSTMREAAERELGKSLDSIFSYIDPYPVGVGSMGQVYRAVTHSNELVAVKLLYPDLDLVLSSDLTLADLLAPILGRFFQPGEFEKLFARMQKKI